MSLFKVREFWSIECDIDEKFDQSCLEVSKLNGDTDKIIIGSHSGILRVYQPATELDENNILQGYKPTDLLIEKLFAEPILQVSTGRLVSGSPNVHIGILHPKSIAIYGLVSKEGAAEHGTQTILKLMYEHKLKRSAANFIVGSFGGSQNRDFICVQSLDGLLTFFEQESFAFCCFLPKFLLPGPFIYAQKTDSFITAGSTWSVESFRYKRLSEAGHNSNEDDSAGTKIESDWSFNLGEGVLDLQCLLDSNKDSYVTVLGEKNFYCLSETGKLKFMKKLDFSPVCFSTYILEDENKLMTLMISNTNTLLIYQNTTVKWSAQLSYLPTAIRRAFFKNLKGAVVFLSEEGKLDCCYLGTEPQLFAAPPLANQELDFEKAEVELTSLTRIIRNYYSTDAKLTNTAAERELLIAITINPHLEDLEPGALAANVESSDTHLQMCLVSVDLTPQAVLEEAQVSIYVQKPLKSAPEVGFYNHLTQKTTFECQIHLAEEQEAPSLDLKVVVSYISNMGVPRVIKKTTALPLKLLMETCAPLKEGQHKITLNINQDPVLLTTLFPEFIGENSLTLASSAVGFKNLNGVGSPVTVLSAKSSQRYRLQSDSLICLNGLVEQMVIRLSKHFSGATDFQMSYSSSLPISQLLENVRNHFEKRKVVNELQNRLSQLGGQFRVIQKRLISKFKDKNPTPLSNLEKLLQNTYSEIISVAGELESELTNLSNAQNELSCALQLLLNLIKLMDVNKDIVPTLETAFSPAVYDLDGQNWEDSLDASLCYLLRTSLSKSEKDKIKASASTFEEITDVAKVEKHISQVLDRITKVGPVIEVHSPGGNEVKQKTEAKNALPKRELLPIGSRIAESSSRILSARKASRKQPNNVAVND